ncbi:MAG: hypothetical protein WA919_12445 [Coleofasciculaceae cyanobacterium]
MMKPRLILTVTCTLVLLLLLQRSFTPASASPALASRISRLEAANLQLRLQVNRLESRVSGLIASDSQPRRNAQLPAPPPSPASPSTTEQNPMFKQLATLVIELKERVTELEERVEELEKSSVS